MENELHKVESSESLVIDDDKNYAINVEFVKNRDEIVDLFRCPDFTNMLQNKNCDVNLKIDLLPGRKILQKKKKAQAAYAINSFIFYTSFVSKLGIKLKNEGVWKIMKNDPEGMVFYKQILSLENFYKRLNVYNEDKTVNREMSDELRRQVIKYARQLMVSCYMDEQPLPPFDNYTRDIFNSYNEFKSGVDSFKRFLNNHQCLKEYSLSSNDECHKRKLVIDEGEDKCYESQSKISNDDIDIPPNTDL
ncbi:39K/PP31 [Epinotia aporema granulovirus]|uniref:39K/PP31 n=1 Tax=Epinotia aporema granulovirus TaxID=166056 RepID=K4EQ22_9BBAC|nr:39K/PP31 [Epinotia aporema granulovirus]AER41482.1 39K/PP31 [Epinotia aporema granulovirus]